MGIGEVIRMYRKEKHMTQEEMGGYLGVTAPAVNKWESGNSFPDILLLGPIARLLGITTDTLLSYKEDLTDQEINQILECMKEKMKSEGYDATFQWAEEKILEYPNCVRLIFLSAQVLDGYRYMYGIDKPETYDEKIHEFYIRSLKSSDYDIVQTAAVSLFHFYLKKKNYEKAQEYLRLIPKRGFHPNQLQANLYLSQGKYEEAYPLYEQMVFAGFSDMNGALNGILNLAIKENDIAKAKSIVNKQRGLAKLLEMGEYMEASQGLDLAVHLQDKEEILEKLSDMIHSMKDMDSYRKSELYSHMTFSNASMEDIAFMLQRGLEGDESIALVKEDARYIELLEELKTLTGR